LNQSSKEPTGECVTSSISIYNLILLNWPDGECQNAMLVATSSDNSRVGSLRDYDNTRARRILLLEGRNLGSDLGNIFGLEFMGFGLS